MTMSTARPPDQPDDAEAIAMLKSAEYAANLDQENWYIWEQVIIYIKEITNLKILDS